MKFAILTVIKCTIQWHQFHSWCYHHHSLLLVGTVFCERAFPPSLPPSLFVFRGREVRLPSSPGFPHTCKSHRTASLHIAPFNQHRLKLEGRCWLDHMQIYACSQVSRTRENTLFWDVSWVLSSSAQGGIAWRQDCIFSVWAPKFSTGALQGPATADGLMPWSSPLHWPRSKHL